MKQFKREDLIPKSQRQRSLFMNPKNLTVFETMLEIYASTADVKNFAEIHIPPLFEEWVTDLYEAHGASTDLIHTDRNLIKQDFPVDLESIIHLVTAGKDSTATAIKFEGTVIRNHLLHVGGVNKIYPTEHRMAKVLYEKFMPASDYNFLKVQMPKITGATESPIKNMFITVLAIEHFEKIPKWITLGGSEKIADISETEVYGDTSRGLVPFLKALNVAYGSELDFTPYLRDQVEAYELCAEREIDYSYMASCMSQLRFKKMQRTYAIDKYSRVVDGRTLMAGSMKGCGTSIFSMTNDKLSTLTLDDLVKVDEVHPESDYRCLQGCFKCREKALVYSKHFMYQYSPEYIKKCKDGIVGWMDKSPNNNKINLNEYFEYVLGIPVTSIPSKYHKYMVGEALRPDGWKPPKVKKKKKPTEVTDLDKPYTGIDLSSSKDKSAVVTVSDGKVTDITEELV